MLERILLAALTVMTAGCTTLHIEEEVGDQPESWGAYIDRSHNECDALVGRYDAHGTARFGSGADHAATLNDVFFYERSNVPAQASSFSVVKSDGGIVIDVTGEFRNSHDVTHSFEAEGLSCVMGVNVITTKYDAGYGYMRGLHTPMSGYRYARTYFLFPGKGGDLAILRVYREEPSSRVAAWFDKHAVRSTTTRAWYRFKKLP